MKRKRKLGALLIVVLILLMAIAPAALAKTSGSSSSKGNNSGSSSSSNSSKDLNSAAAPKGVTINDRYSKVYATGTHENTGHDVTLKAVVGKDGNTKWVPVSNSNGGGGSGGGGSSNPSVTPDLTVTNITPSSYRGNSTVISTVTVQGLQAASVNGVEVRFDAGGAMQSKTINVPANSKATVTFTWTAPSSGPVTLTATVNPAQTVTETDYSNNSYSRSVSIQPPFIDAIEQPTPVPIPARPGGENNDYVTWEETENGVTTSYWARLTLTAMPSVSQLKSGYGFGVTVSANVSTNYHTSFAPSQVVMFIPERGYNEVVRLVNSGGTWTLPVSPYSPIGAQKWYVPVWFPDATMYSANVTAVGASTPGGELTATIPVSIYINSNMYTDDSTNNTWAR